MPRARSTTILVIVLVLILLVVTWVVAERRRAERMTARSAATTAAFLASCGQRNRFAELAPNPDDAWLHYQRVAAALTGGPGAVLSAAIHLRNAAASARTIFPGFDPRLGFDAPLPAVIDWMDRAQVFIDHGADLARRGDPASALRVLSDTLVLGRDLAATGSLVALMSGWVIVDRVVAVLEDMTLGGLPAPVLAQLDADLAKLEAAWPSFATVTRFEGAMATNTVFGSPVSTGTLARDFGFWGSLLAPMAVTRHVSHVEAVSAACALPWEQARAAADAAAVEVLDTWNPAQRLFVTRGLLNHMRNHRAGLAQLRALREVVHYLRVGERLGLADPFGASTLQLHADDDGVACWSTGADGEGEPKVTLR